MDMHELADYLANEIVSRVYSLLAAHEKGYNQSDKENANALISSYRNLVETNYICSLFAKYDPDKFGKEQNMIKARLDEFEEELSDKLAESL
jgi:two-component sensor histidine kinase